MPSRACRETVGLTLDLLQRIGLLIRFSCYGFGRNRVRSIPHFLVLALAFHATKLKHEPAAAPPGNRGRPPTHSPTTGDVSLPADAVDQAKALWRDHYGQHGAWSSVLYHAAEAYLEHLLFHPKLTMPAGRQMCHSSWAVKRGFLVPSVEVRKGRAVPSWPRLAEDEESLAEVLEMTESGEFIPPVPDACGDICCSWHHIHCWPETMIPLYCYPGDIDFSDPALCDAAITRWNLLVWHLSRRTEPWAKPLPGWTEGMLQTESEWTDDNRYLLVRKLEQLEGMSPRALSLAIAVSRDDAASFNQIMCDVAGGRYDRNGRHGFNEIAAASDAADALPDRYPWSLRFVYGLVHGRNAFTAFEGAFHVKVTRQKGPKSADWWLTVHAACRVEGRNYEGISRAVAEVLAGKGGATSTA